jgi:hypothetical protein
MMRVDIKHTLIILIGLYVREESARIKLDFTLELLCSLSPEILLQQPACGEPDQPSSIQG